MDRLKVNILANFGGQAWSALINLALVPIYIRYVGIESFGLVGFYNSLVFIANSLFDFGLSITINRELAQRTTRGDRHGELRDFVRTFEIFYWLIGLLVGLVAWLLVPFLANNWLNANTLPTEVVQSALALMALLITIQWPVSFYQGGLMGLEKQVLLNVINTTAATARSVGAVLVLHFINPSIITFLTWQIFVIGIQVIVTALFLWMNLPKNKHFPRFKPRLLAPVWRFSAGLTATSLVTFSLTQIDKIILSKLLSLEMFGYYTVAATVANGIRLISSPIFLAIFPRFSALIAQKDYEAVKILYHKASQLISVAIFPITCILALFSYEVLLLWMRDETTATLAAPVASLLVIGSGLNSIVGLPYDIQIAHGWTKLGFYKNLIASIVIVPLTYILAKQYGSLGAASVSIILNSSYLLIEIPIMHTRLLRGEMRKWYLEDVTLPFFAASSVAIIGRVLFPQYISNFWMFLGLFLVSLLTLTACAYAAPYIRLWLTIKAKWLIERIQYATS